MELLTLILKNLYLMGIILCGNFGINQNKGSIYREVIMNFTEALRKEKTLFYIEGFLLMALGLIAILLPQITTVSIAILAGIVLVIAGIVMFFRAFRLKQGKVFWVSLLSGIVAVGAGALMLGNLGSGMYVLTFFLIVFLAFEGVLKILTGGFLRPLKNWGYLFFSGIVSLLLTFIIIAGLPETVFWALGLLLGVYLLFAGFSMVAFAIGLEKPFKERAH